MTRLCFGFLFLLYASSCSRQPEDNRETLVSGEVFITLPNLDKPGEKRIILQPGESVFFLTEDEKKRFANLCRDWLDKERQRYKAKLNDLEKRKASLTQQEEFDLALEKRYPPTIQAMRISGSDASQDVSALLRSAKSVATDSKGEFAVKLRRGTSYWVLAGGSTPHWCFRLDSSSPRVVLSDGNSIEELGDPF